MSLGLVLLTYILISISCFAAEPETKTAASTPTNMDNEIKGLVEPLYNPFVERYVLDELKQLRTDQAKQRHELMQQILDREHKSIDRAVSYSTDTVTYFFYLIAGVTSILLLVGWTSFREIKERAHTIADEEIEKLISEYEQRLQAIELQLGQKALHIRENREEIELTREVQALWLRAGQDENPNNKISIYDEILKLRPADCEALTYKADSVLELGEPQWAANLCHQVLDVDPDNSHAFYQLACAYSAMEQYESAVRYLQEALNLSESYRNEISNDSAFDAMKSYEPFIKLMNQ